ncbi:N-acetylmuramoyl-L-alanine amidase family protein [Halonatronum saccharophilum]|uniref:N-acetylmuramoyl-L-alanine amidase family protein n=1 Tax=Halonatronum saccharophilum TaxID=150060 RepID=UPI0004B4C9CA|nr:N-acetylmuramoyl-L-alanine amidase [Halonatronum saccharophilum]
MIIKISEWKIYLSILFIYLIFFLPKELNLSNIIVKTPPLGQRVVVIDAGHGGIDGGTTYGGILEKDINLKIASKLKDYLLEKSDTKVIMTREEDISLDHLNNYSRSRHTRDIRARIDIINQKEVDLFISIHVDNRLGQRSMRGPVVLYSSRHKENKTIAETLQKHLNNLGYQGVEDTKHNIKRRNDLYILKSQNTPGVLVEVGFITNPLDWELLQKTHYQQALVEGIYRGIEEYFSGFKFFKEVSF